MAEGFAYVAAAVTALWGLAHVVPTARVVAGFEPLTADNRRVLVQEWLAEAVTMWGTAAAVVVATAIGAGEAVTRGLYFVAAAVLLVIGALTAVTGARTPVVWFKICPVVMTFSAVLLILAGLLGH